MYTGQVKWLALSHTLFSIHWCSYALQTKFLDICWQFLKL